MLTLIRCLFHLVLLQWHVKDPGHCAISAGGRIHQNMQTPLSQGSWSRLTMLSKHSAGTHQGKTSSNTLVRKHSATVMSAGRATALLLGSLDLLADGCEPRGTPVRRDSPSCGWSKFVQNTPQVSQGSQQKGTGGHRQFCRSSFKAVQSMVWMLPAITNEGRG